MARTTDEGNAIEAGFFNKEVSDYEVTAVYVHPEATADIVLVHGLNGHPKRTWRSKNDVFWPTDLLPVSLENEKANVLVYGYNADVYTSNNAKSPSDNFILQHARSLVTSLTQFRKCERRAEVPIIWVMHSFGGIVVKKALLFSNELQLSEQEDYRSIYVSTYALIFLGTPHSGSDIAKWAHVIEAALNVALPQKFFASESRLLKSLKKDNGELQAINSQFLNICRRFKMHMVHENHKTSVKTSKKMIVDSESACPQLPGVVYYGIEATHAKMCKFDNNNAPGFRNISTAIRDWVTEAPLVISQRWVIEYESRRDTVKHEIDERMIPLMRLRSGTPQQTSLHRSEAISTLGTQVTQSFESPKTSLPMKEDPVLIRTEHEVADYMHQLKGKDHDLWDTSTSTVRYDEYSHEWKPEQLSSMADSTQLDHYDLYQECFEIRDSLSATINRCRGQYGHDPFVESKQETWNDVQEAIRQFCNLAQFESKSLDNPGLVGRLRKSYLSQNRSSFDFVRFLSRYTPSRFLLSSVMCAGLKTLFVLMSLEVRQNHILHGIAEELPLALNRPISFVEAFGTDEQFHRKVSAIYNSMLKLIRLGLKLFIMSPNQVEADSLRLEKLADRMVVLKIRVNKLHIYASSVSYLKLKELQVLQERNLVVSSLSLRAQDELKQRLDETLQRVIALEGLKEILIDERRRDFEQVQVETLEQSEIGNDSGNEQQYVSTEINRQSISDRALSEPSTNTSDKGLNIKQILNLLEFDPLLMPSDCYKLLKIQPVLAGLRSSRLLYVIHNIRLRAWLELDESSLLLINGGGDSLPISEVSYLTARLVESFIMIARPTTKIATMAYLCGQHRHMGSDAYSSPMEMAMSILCQLIDTNKDIFPSKVVLDALDGLDPGVMATICDSIERLLLLLEKDVLVFIVIEGLNFFSYPTSRQAETGEFLRRLISMHRGAEVATIKLLFTCPSRVPFWEDLFESSEIINVPRSPPEVGVWSDSAFKKLFGELQSDSDDSSDESCD